MRIDGCICFRAFCHCQIMVLSFTRIFQAVESLPICSFLVLSSLPTLAHTVRVCYYMPSLQSLDEWQSLLNFAQTKSDDECCGFAKESSWWLVSFVLCLLVFLVLLRLLGERPFKSVQMSFCTVCHRNHRLLGSLENWTMNF